MKNELLDDVLMKDNDTKIHPSLLNWTSIILLWIGIVMSLLFGIYSMRIIAACLLLAITSIICYWKFDIGVKIMLGIIVAGMFNIIEFFPITYEFSFGIEQVQIRIEIILLIIGLVHYLTNKEYLFQYVENFFYDKEDESEDLTADRSRVNGFKRRFSNKPLSELEIISKNGQLVPEARLAAEELIKEKRIKNSED